MRGISAIRNPVTDESVTRLRMAVFVLKCVKEESYLMARFSPFKSKEPSGSPEIAIAEQNALESMAKIESELKQREIALAQPENEKEEETPLSESLTGHSAASLASSQTVHPLTGKIEAILEEDLTDLYLKMSSDQQKTFKRQGEETSSKIGQLLAQAKVNAKKIFDLLRAWLKLIPGVNRFFLEQEAKIKTDKILLMHDQEKK